MPDALSLQDMEKCMGIDRTIHKTFSDGQVSGNSNKSYFCRFKFIEAKMKKVLLISALALVAVSCSNSNKTEAQEEKERDSSISVQKSEDDKIVAEMIRQDSLREAQEQAAKDSSVK